MLHNRALPGKNPNWFMEWCSLTSTH